MNYFSYQLNVTSNKPSLFLQNAEIYQQGKKLLKYNYNEKSNTLKIKYLTISKNDFIKNIRKIKSNYLPEEFIKDIYFFYQNYNVYLKAINEKKYGIIVLTKNNNDYILFLETKESLKMLLKIYSYDSYKVYSKEEDFTTKKIFLKKN